MTRILSAGLLAASSRRRSTRRQGVDEVSKSARETAAESAGLPALAVLAIVAGLAAGLVTALFRLALAEGDELRGRLIDWAHLQGPVGFAVVLASAAGVTALAAWLVRRLAPHAKGSGIPHVEAVLRGDLPPAPLSVIPVKFAGGLLAIATGLALGREGPSVQMGAGLAHLVGQTFRRSNVDRMALLAAGAGAGLATAFNAPVAGSVFVLEELVRRFDTRITVTTLGASASAIAVGRLVLGSAPDFEVAALPFASQQSLPLYLLLGLLCGFVGVAYNAAILGALAAQLRMRRWPVEVRAGLIGASVGMLAWFAPRLVGGGETITQHTLTGGETALALAGMAIIRFALGAVSYSAGTPGGLFAPMLAVGAQFGMVCGLLGSNWFPELVPQPAAFAVVGMAAFFTAVVRAPVTGIVLITEMTGSFTLLLPLLVACFPAMAVPTMLRSLPIYDSLREPAADAPKDQAFGRARAEAERG